MWRDLCSAFRAVEWAKNQPAPAYYYEHCAAVVAFSNKGEYMLFISSSPVSQEAALGAAVRNVSKEKPGWSVGPHLSYTVQASGIEARSDETPQAAQPEGRESDPNASEGDAQP